MADLSASYLGLTLRNPFIAGASGYTANVERIRQLEESGAGALVTSSLFEEQIQYESYRLEEDLSRFDNLSQEVVDVFPQLKHAGAKEHLMWVRRTKEAVRIPVIASLNAAAPGSWSEYAKQLEDAGADAIEVNIYNVNAAIGVTGEEVERQYLEIVRSVRRTVKVPVALKLSPFFTSFANVAKRFDDEGVNALVLFNRFLQPDIDLDRMALNSSMQLSNPWEMLLPLRWTAILHGRVKCDLAASTGVHDAAGVVKMLLAGSTVVQLAAALLRNGVTHLATLRSGLQEWMERGHFSAVDDFRGTLSQKEAKDPRAFERAQYVNLILSQNM